MGRRKWIYTLESALFGLLVCLLVYSIYDIEGWKSVLYALLAIAVQYFSWNLFSFKTMVSYSCSFVPASLCVMHLIKGGYVWLALSIVALLALVWLFRRERVESRNTTRAWVSQGIYMIVMSLTAAIIVS